MSRLTEPPAGARSRALAWLIRVAPAVVVILVAAAVLWPVPAGRMPLSADHTVHLTRIVLTGRRLVEQGALSGWEPTWFFGFPLGELYPQLGDLLILGIRALSLGNLEWSQAYALGFFVVFALQGLALLRVGRLFGLGPWPGLIAALLVLVDPGFTREGGWLYTVYFGVWPQALATSLAWLGLGEMARALGVRSSATLVDAAGPEPKSESGSGSGFGSDGDDAARRATLWAGLCFAAALLAHPIALPTLGIGGLILVATVVPRGPTPWRVALARCLVGGAIGALAAAWWWLPMLQHRAWMASYGWLHASLDAMLRWASRDGALAQRMPAAVGYLAMLGLVLAALGLTGAGAGGGAGRGEGEGRGEGSGAGVRRAPGRAGVEQVAGRAMATRGGASFARFVALFALAQWLLASSDVFWLLRLDRLSEGFTHIQWQRFLIGAKPGLFLCAGLAVVAPAAWARRLVLRARAAGGADKHAGGLRWAWTLAALAPTFATLAAAAWLLDDSKAAMREHEVGAVQIERIPGEPQAERDYREFLAWAGGRWEAREGDYRLAVRAARNSHWFMDAPVWTSTPQYKLGFTPGDNFVHKPESGRREVLDALGVRWMVSRERGSRARPGEVARFGSIVVRERQGARPWPLVEVVEGGRVELLAADLRAGVVRARLEAAPGEDLAGRQLRFAIAGYPRWQLVVDGRPLEWVEVPVHGDAAPATQAARRAGQLRGGKAEGDDGSEPTLIAATLPESTGAGPVEVELRYRGRGALDLAAQLCSLLTVVLVWISLSQGPGGGSGAESGAESGTESRWLERLRAVPGRLRRLLGRAEAGLARALHPIVVGALLVSLLALAGQRWWSAAQREADTLLGWVSSGVVSVNERATPGPVKTDMLIRPAVLLRPRPDRPARVELELPAMPARLEGWLGLDDDQAQQRGSWARHELRVEVRALGDAGSADESWSTLRHMSVAHEPQQVPFVIEAGAFAGQPVRLRIIDEVRGERVPRLGIELELGQAHEVAP
ncbi:hypothetical protein G6O69_04095 [Pseudenhygromyxa sp. WMMC2535]|uniref:hypothetical protein n=1 Tax=Pseudenhygromyxa sp. WMMC2535 TaxID=2712867 RepID=UPI00155818FF|nr:hypothetical protein [Pseudenhygromyxa sp. WMMC2535]NVB36998.1 hypothetical protein [Pseudenhygromyxa sp. WMMC2535]